MHLYGGVDDGLLLQVLDRHGMSPDGEVLILAEQVPAVPSHGVRH